MPNPWLLAARPKTLAAAVVPVLVGTALARNQVAATNWSAFLFALGGAVLIQIGTNLVNDALDFRKGADTAERLGPLRVTQGGLLGAAAVLRGAVVCFVLAALCGVPLIVRGGWPIAVIGVVSILAAYAYTGGPYPLAYHGLGEVFVMIFFGLVATGGSYYLQTLRCDGGALIAGFACGALAVVLLAINNLRDVASDRASNKRTLAARFGERFARGEIEWMLLAAYLAVAVLAYLRDWHLAAPVATFPLAVLLMKCVQHGEGRELNRCLAMAGALDWLFGITFVIGAVI
jgi:1,4-dihydroxy-2-naphthoate octaprenyltransferase